MPSSKPWANLMEFVINPAGLYPYQALPFWMPSRLWGIPAAEVHISDVTQREDFRQISYAGMACCCHVIGKRH